ncbi:hypothetical protein [Streptomyces paradoxus]|uniref:hypothetical protein n=1 Tax=Streptomyces paradoxus TaxID=66375 RepID=UPI0037D2D76B
MQKEITSRLLSCVSERMFVELTAKRDLWSAQCHESGTPGAGSGPKKRLDRKTGPRFGPTSPARALRAQALPTSEPHGVSGRRGRGRASCFRLVAEGCAMKSMLGLLLAREAAARERVEVLRKEAARAVAALEAGEDELDRRVIACEELVEALTASAVENIAVTEAGGGRVAVPEPVSAPVAGAVVPFWRGDLEVSVLSEDYQRIVRVLQDRPGGEAMRAEDIAAALGLDASVPAKVEGVRSKAKRLGERGWLLQEPSGMFSARRVV